ncbi:MAG: PD40 domain-containing protein [Bacteroidaceae bacterium]|nr:PD40 domain-containing protein [Bacteroidaceae bacterium]
MKKLLLFISILLFVACSSPTVPQDAQQENRTPRIFPEYADVTVPCNICPLNFAVREDASEAVARLTAADGTQQVYGDGNKIVIDETEWKEMLEASKGKSIKVEVYANANGKWHAYKPFCINVATDTIDRYISYRLIQPSYVAYEKLVIAQRDLTTFEEKEIYNNMSVSTDANAQCINCHSYRNFKTDQMLFHMRQAYGGTMIVQGSELKKVDLKTDKTISAGVYPAWNPAYNIIAFSTNKTGQQFHTNDNAKVEVMDTESDLIIYDVDKNTVSIVSELRDELEVFPTWSPDGNTLYYCSAHLQNVSDSTDLDKLIHENYQRLFYDIYAIDYDNSTKTFSNKRKIYNSAAIEKSASLPRVSPDGRYLLFAQGNYGCFHVWHKEADIMMLDLTKLDKENPDNNIAINLKAMNSPRSESYPTWSSSGRWIMTASRRDDGNYTRPFIAYFDRQGKVHKAFELPQADPDFYTDFTCSFNRPEFMVEPVKISPQQFTQKAKEDAVKVKLAE